MVDFEKLEKLEKQNKTSLFNYLEEIYNFENILLNYIHNNIKQVPFDLKSDFPNTGITLNNKILEIANSLKKLDIPFYAEYRETKDEYGTPFINNAIVHDLSSLNGNAIMILAEIDSYLAGMAHKNINSILSELFILYDAIRRYNEINDFIFNYSLENNLLASIDKERNNTKYTYDDFETYIKPSLDKLGINGTSRKLER